MYTQSFRGAGGAGVVSIPESPAVEPALTVEAVAAKAAPAHAAAARIPGIRAWAGAIVSLVGSRNNVASAPQD